MSEHHIHLTLEFSFASKWHTGSGEGCILTDRLIRKDVRGKPYILGSTLKGIIRESCEKLSKTLGFDAPTDPHQTDLNIPGAFVPLAQAPSPIDQIFGTKYEEGGLIFRNASPVGEEYRNFFVQNRICMNRKLRTAKDRHLFGTEYGVPLTFKTEIEGNHKNLTIIEESDPPFAYCLLVSGIRMVDRIGGDKSSGSGHLQNNIVITSFEYNGNQIPVDHYLKETARHYLEADDYKEWRNEQ